jgi:hypothetical protein
MEAAVGIHGKVGRLVEKRTEPADAHVADDLDL